MQKTFIELFGWYGMVAIVGAYALLNFGYFSVDSLWYQLLNITGSMGLLVVSLYKRAYQPGVLNAVWMVIALAAMLQALR